MVWRASSSSPTNRRFTAFAISVACWATGVGGSHSGHYMDFWMRVAFGAAVTATVSIFGFIAAYPSAEGQLSQRLLQCAYGVAAVLTILTFTTDLIVFEPYLAGEEIRRRTGPLYWIFASFCIVIWMFAFVLFFTRWRVARGRARAELQYLGAGMLLPGCGVLVTNLLWPLLTGRSTHSWIGPWFGVMFAAIAAHAIVRRRLTDLHLVAHRSLTIAIAIILSTLPVVILLGVWWPRLLRQLDTLELGVLLVAVAIATVLIPITRDVSNHLLDRYVYRTHANYQRTVHEASRVLTRVLHLETLLAFISTTVERSTPCEGLALYLREDSLGGDGSFRCAISERAQLGDRFHAPPQAPIPVLVALDSLREPLLSEEIGRDPGIIAAPGVHDCLIEVNWSLVLPVISEDRLIAVLALGPKLSGDAFYQEDIDLLMTLANQAGVAIKNAQLYAAVVLANEYLENIAATIQSGVVAVNATGRITMLNRAAEELTGLRAGDITGGEAGRLPLSLSESLLATVQDGQPRAHPEVELPTVTPISDGPTSRPVMCTTSPIRDPNGSVLGAVVVFSDLTPLKELELERRRAERLGYFQAVAAGIAHEIKNPLVAIKTFTQLLPRRRDDERFIEEFGRMSIREIERMQQLVDRLQTLSRPSGGLRLPVDLRVPISEALELVRPTLEQKHLSVSARLGSASYVLLGNQRELEQLFLNLLLNAHDATPSGGNVAVDLTSNETHVVASVSDTGSGIEVDLLERVFEPFFTTKPRGSGLGLAISAGIAQAHGARLRASNRVGGGAAFTVEFPLTSLTSRVVA
jgi:PAS domain S-box-containing protein